MMNTLRSVLSVLLLTISAMAQFTLPPEVLPGFEQAQLTSANPKVIPCGSVQFESVTFDDRIVLSLPITTPWPPLDWENWSDEDRQELLDSMAHSALLAAFADPASFLLEYWKNLASAIGMRDYTCDRCPVENSSQCLMSASATIVMPIAPEDIQVISVGVVGSVLMLVVDFSPTFDVWITCDTKEGCR